MAGVRDNRSVKMPEKVLVNPRDMVSVRDSGEFYVLYQRTLMPETLITETLIAETLTTETFIA